MPKSQWNSFLFLNLFSPFLQFHPKFHTTEPILQPNMGTSHMQTFWKPVKVSLSHFLLALMTNKSFNTFKMGANEKDVSWELASAGLYESGSLTKPQYPQMITSTRRSQAIMQYWMHWRMLNPILLITWEETNLRRKAIWRVQAHLWVNDPLKYKRGKELC